MTKSGGKPIPSVNGRDSRLPLGCLLLVIGYLSFLNIQLTTNSRGLKLVETRLPKDDRRAVGASLHSYL
ncbi:MAG: hypothetical protein F6J86_06890 [Symploca sp. SIO1B1]|nr:hypothetical protein [Symploca sp. SIO1B1]